MDPNTALLGHMAVHRGLLTQDQLRVALQLQLVSESQGEPQPLGQILVSQGYISEANLQELLRAQQDYLGGRAGAQPTTETRAPAPAPTEAPPEVDSGLDSDVDELPPPPTGVQVETSAPGALEELSSVLERALSMGATDVHIHSQTPVLIRVQGRLRPVGKSAVVAPRAERLLGAALKGEQHALLQSTGEVDFVLDLGERGRFRGNIFRHERGLSGTFRHIAPKPPSLAELGLPNELARLMSHHQGMVLVTGPQRSGKSSTLAALIDVVNRERQDHVLTVEDPIEFVHTSRECIITQRQVERHTQTFASALRGALREDPDIIVIGELRDLETISLALTAAETGHLVLGTLTTTSAIRTIERVIGAYPARQQAQVRTMLSEALRAVISQRLLPRAQGSSFVAALEVLHVTKAASNLIREGKTFQLQSVMQTGASLGMRMLDDALTALVADGSITRAEARRVAEDPARFPKE